MHLAGSRTLTNIFNKELATGAADTEESSGDRTEASSLGG